MSVASCVGMCDLVDFMLILCGILFDFVIDIGALLRNGQSHNEPCERSSSCYGKFKFLNSSTMAYPMLHFVATSSHLWAIGEALIFF